MSIKIDTLVNPKVIYYDNNIDSSNIYTARANSIISKFPNAEIRRVNSHWNIKELNQDESNVESWVKNKRDYLILGIKKGISFRDNGRSTDFIAPSQSSGCAMACQFCYTARRKGYANPVTVFLNTDQVAKAIDAHQQNLGPKHSPNQCDPNLWTYEIGENSDVSVDAYLSTNIKYLVAYARSMTNAKLSFATKYVNYDMLDYDPQRKTRIRFSLMPQAISKYVDIKCSPIEERIAAINDFYKAGYEVHVNFSPVILYPQWKQDYLDLFDLLDSSISQEVKDQLKCEVIFLTHNQDLHDLNLQWNPKGEDFLWKPSIQENKLSQNGMTNIRYKYQLKSKYIESFKNLLNSKIPYCQIRYIF